ncbi:unnamed protein product [Schistocephalus solidus]|uniref:Sm domain-containing protein n=1 Tax=Schistocephalus solidus TaxID=70667 RepID=A0A183SIB9_SCHSO|nr:unnamed protein product [Schistocephalus solidus]
MVTSETALAFRKESLFQMEVEVIEENAGEDFPGDAEQVNSLMVVAELSVPILVEVDVCGILEILKELSLAPRLLEERSEMEVIQLPGFVRIDGPGFCSVKACRQGEGLVNLQFGVQVNTVAIQHKGLQPKKGLIGFGDPLGNIIVDSRVACQRAS